MRDRLAAIGGIIMSIISGSGSGADAMSKPEPRIRCSVTNADRLPERSGGADALCKQILAAVSPDAVRAVDIEVGKNAMMTANVQRSDGRMLEPVHVAVAGRDIGIKEFERLAGAIARQLEK